MRKYLLMLGVIALAVGVAATQSGCSSSIVPAKASGKVTYKGNVLKAGNLTFHHETMGPYGTTLAMDGTYEIKDLPEGDFVVTIDTEAVNPDRSTPAYGGGGGGRGGPGPGAGAGAGGKPAPPAQPKPGAVAGDKKAAADLEKQRNDRRSQEAAGGFGPPPIEELRAKYTKIPDKYNNKAKSELKASLKRGSNSGVDFELKD